jgi:hypothetical protein
MGTGQRPDQPNQMNPYQQIIKNYGFKKGRTDDYY